jgi:hypothetical protein
MRITVILRPRPLSALSIWSIILLSLTLISNFLSISSSSSFRSDPFALSSQDLDLGWREWVPASEGLGRGGAQPADGGRWAGASARDQSRPMSLLWIDLWCGFFLWIELWLQRHRLRMHGWFVFCGYVILKLRIYMCDSVLWICDCEDEMWRERMGKRRERKRVTERRGDGP